MLALALLLAGRHAGAQRPALAASRVAWQVGAGTVATPVAFLGGGLLAKRLARRAGAEGRAASRAGYIGAYGATVLASSIVPAAIGRGGHLAAAVAGSGAGLLGAVALVRLGNARYDADRRRCGVLCWTLGAAVVALPSVGATLAYDRSRR